MTITTKPYDSADYLKSEEAIALYLEEILRDCDAALLTEALGVAARARGMARTARETGLGREALNRSLSSEAGPELETVLKMLKAMNLRLSVTPIVHEVEAAE